MVFKESRDKNYFPYKSTRQQLAKGGTHTETFLTIYWFCKHILCNRIYQVDKPTDYHSHPTGFISIVLRGGYTQDVIKKDGTIIEGQKCSWWNIISNRSFHRVYDIKPNTLTLVLNNPFQKPIGMTLLLKGAGIWWTPDPGKMSADNEYRIRKIGE